MANEDENTVEDLDARIQDLEGRLAESEERAEEARRDAARERERANDATSKQDLESARRRFESDQHEAAEKKAAEEREEFEDRLVEAKNATAAASAELARVTNKLADTQGQLDAASTGRDKAQEQLEKVENDLASVRGELDDTKEDRDRRGKFEELAKEEFEGRTELREFVASSLVDIMRGVDEAALSAVSHHLQSGLLEEPMISPSRVGHVVGGSETLVHFDLAVVASTQTVDGSSKGKAGGIGISVRGKLWEHIGLSGTADFKMHSQSFVEERSGLTQDQRIRFSVPLIFASQDELVG